MQLQRRPGFTFGLCIGIGWLGHLLARWSGINHRLAEICDTILVGGFFIFRTRLLTFTIWFGFGSARRGDIAALKRFYNFAIGFTPVSYTHLTLPTSDLV